MQPAAGICCATLLVLTDGRFRRPLLFLTALSVFFSGFLYAWAMLVHAPPIMPEWTAGLAGRQVEITARTKSVHALPEQRLRIVLEDVRVLNGKESTRLAGLCVWTWDRPTAEPMPGQMIAIKRKIFPARGFANSGTNIRDILQNSQNIRWRIWSRANAGRPEITGDGGWWVRQRNALKKRFIAVLGRGLAPDAALPQSRAIVLALLFGDRFFLSSQTMELFSGATLAHSLALSGQHLVLAGLAGLFGVLLAGRLFPGLYLARPRRILVAAASAPPALLYLWLGNAPPSLVRAVCMLLVFSICLWRGMVFNGMDVLFAAFGFILVFNPAAMLDVGLQLSFLCVGAILLGLKLLKGTWPFRKNDRGLTALLARIFCISLLVQIALLPLNLLHFGQAGFCFPLNVLWLPVVDFWVLPCSALGLLASLVTGLEDMAHSLLACAYLPCGILLDFLCRLHAENLLEGSLWLRPHWSVLPAFALISVALVCTGSRNMLSRRLLALGVAFLAIGPALRLNDSLHAGLRLEALDVGQGQAMLLHAAGASILLDGGGSSSPRFDPGRDIVAPILLDNRPPRLSAVISSHPDLDHLGGLLHIIRHFPVLHVFHNGRDAGGRHKEAWKNLREEKAAIELIAGNEIFLPESGLRLEILHPDEKKAAGKSWSGNDASLVLRLCRGMEGLVLFTGDAGLESLRHLVRQGANLRAKVLVAPHHGSNGSFLKEFYASVAPEIIIACCGFANRYGYPGAKLRAWAKDNGALLLDTGTSGRIILDFAEKGIRVKEMRGMEKS